MFKSMRTSLAALGIAVSLSTSTLADEPVDETAAVEATIHAVYDVISGPVGEERDFERMRALYMDGAAMGAVGPGPDGQGRGRVITLDDYIERSGPWLVENGFVEVPTRTDISVWGEIATARSAYEGTNSATGETFLIGVNFITLFKIEGEWKIASILWRTETDDWPVEAAFEH